MSMAIITKSRDEEYICKLIRRVIGSSKEYILKAHWNELNPQSQKDIDVRSYGTHFKLERLEGGRVSLHYYLDKNPMFWTPDIKTWYDVTEYDTESEALSAIARIVIQRKINWLEAYTEKTSALLIWEVVF